MKAKLAGKRIVIWDKKAEKIYDDGSCGKFENDKLELTMLEAAYLLEKKEITIDDFTLPKFLEYCSQNDPRFGLRFTVYKDLRKRDLPTRTGFKFGCDFRIYGKGVKPMKHGPKTADEHTKWVVFAVPEDFKFSYPELSRAARLAHNIRANMLWAIVGKKGDVSYYSMKFFKP